MIERYIYAFEKEFPKKYRKENRDKLELLIAEMMTNMEDNLSEETKIERIIMELGDPKKLAKTYIGKERYLIGPNYFDKYIFVMKIVALSILVGISISSVLGWIFSPESPYKMIINYISSLLSTLLQGTAWVTGIFALLEYNKVSLDSDKDEKAWDISKLPRIPKEKSLISIGESVFSIVMNTIFMVFLLLPDKLGIYYNLEGSSKFFPIFNTEEFNNYRTVIVVIFIINITVEIVKIIKGKWTVKLAIMTTILDIISLSLFINILLNKKIWNIDTMQIVNKYSPISIFDMITYIIVIIIIFTIIDSISAFYKAIKYGSNNY